jgi:hypothetical protein
MTKNRIATVKLAGSAAATVDKIKDAVDAVRTDEEAIVWMLTHVKWVRASGGGGGGRGGNKDRLREEQYFRETTTGIVDLSEAPEMDVTLDESPEIYP